MNNWSARANVTLISKEKVEKEPDIASIGGFAVVDDGGNITSFDWLQSEGYNEMQDDGRLTMEWYLREFDEEFYTDSNEEGEGEPDWESILKQKIEEIYYETGYIVDGLETEGPVMEVAYFAILLWNDQKGDYEAFEFPEREIREYNERERKRREAMEQEGDK
jgi:hypothetical protein